MSQSRITTSLRSLQNRLHARARDLQNAEGVVHTLRLEQLARDRHIHELAVKVAELEAQLARAPQTPVAPVQAAPSEDPELEQLRAEMKMRAQELELQDRIVEAAQRERATHIAYIEQLESRLVSPPQAPTETASSLRQAFAQSWHLIRREINRR